MMTSDPSSESPLRCPERNPSPNPINSNKEATPHAMPNIVRNDRSLFAPIDWKTCAKMSKSARMTVLGLHSPPCVTQIPIKEFQILSLFLALIGRNASDSSSGQVHQGPVHSAHLCAANAKRPLLPSTPLH